MRDRNERRERERWGKTEKERQVERQVEKERGGGEGGSEGETGMG